MADMQYPSYDKEKRGLHHYFNLVEMGGNIRNYSYAAKKASDQFPSHIRDIIRDVWSLVEDEARAAVKQHIYDVLSADGGRHYADSEWWTETLGDSLSEIFAEGEDEDEEDEKVEIPEPVAFRATHNGEEVKFRHTHPTVDESYRFATISPPNYAHMQHIVEQAELDIESLKTRMGRLKEIEEQLDSYGNMARSRYKAARAAYERALEETESAEEVADRGADK